MDLINLFYIHFTTLYNAFVHLFVILLLDTLNNITMDVPLSSKFIKIRLTIRVYTTTVLFQMMFMLELFLAYFTLITPNYTTFQTLMPC